jgi:hypothetical protein
VIVGSSGGVLEHEGDERKVATAIIPGEAATLRLAEVDRR